MQIFFTDESGLTPKSFFFILGAIGIDESILESIEKGLAKIKQSNKIPPNVEVKWNLNDFNKQMRDNNLPTLDQEAHKKIKSKIVDLIYISKPSNLFVLWYLSPLEFFNEDPWRSYHYAMNVLFRKINQLLEKNRSRGIILLDEITRLKENRTKTRSLIEQFIHTYKEKGKSKYISLIISDVNSNICFGHQLNDLLIGLLSNYLIHIHSKTTNPSSDVVKAIRGISSFIPANFRNSKKVAVYGAGVHIYPKRYHKAGLKKMVEKTYYCFSRDFKFC